MLQALRERLTLIFLALLPLHAFLVTVGTRFIAGEGVAPLRILAVWKEAFLAVILAIAVIELSKALQDPEKRPHLLRFNWIDWLIIGLTALGLAVSLFNSTPLKSVTYGIRYDIVMMGLFVIFSRVSWSESFPARVMSMLVFVGCAVASFGLISLFLPTSFFTWLGYSDLHSLYLPGGPIAAFQYIGGETIRRLQSTFSGPNHVGLWLLIPFSITLVQSLRGSDELPSLLDKIMKFMRHTPWQQWVASLSILAILFIAIFFSYSRAALLSAMVIVFIALAAHFGSRKRMVVLSRVGMGFFYLILLVILFKPSVLVRTHSTLEHIRQPIAATLDIINDPIGRGLGTAGPASNRVSDACVFLPPGSDATWAKDRQNLCVFIGQNQVQPVDKHCKCPVVPENWYLQMGIEMGILGVIFFVLLTALMIYYLWRQRQEPLAFAVALAFIGISIAGLFLHSWEESATAYGLWLLAAVALRRKD